MVFSQNTICQQTIEVVKSDYLLENQHVKIVKSAKFDSLSPFQTFIVLDADNLFDYTVATIDYLQKWKPFPQYIVVGLSNKDRWNELQASSTEVFQKLPFYLFLKEELSRLDEIKNASFKTIIGHSLSAQFAMEYFFNNLKEYNAIVALSPPFQSKFRKSVSENLRKIQEMDRYIYTCSSKQDLNFHKLNFKLLKKELKSNKIRNIKLDFFEENNEITHALIPLQGISQGILFLTKDYFSFPTNQLKKYLNEKVVPDSLLEISYQEIKKIYSILPSFRSEDIQEYVDFYTKKRNYSEALRLSEIAIKNSKEKDVYELIDAYYLKGFVLEQMKDYSNSLFYYKKGFELLTDEVLNKSDFEVDILRVQKKLDKMNLH